MFGSVDVGRQSIGVYEAPAARRSSDSALWPSPTARMLTTTSMLPGSGDRRTLEAVIERA
jgi:hypothetical protein